MQLTHIHIVSTTVLYSAGQNAIVPGFGVVVLFGGASRCPSNYNLLVFRYYVAVIGVSNIYNRVREFYKNNHPQLLCFRNVCTLYIYIY